MRIGSRDKLISVVRDTETGKNAFNEAIREPRVIAVLRAAKRGLSGREYLAAAQIAAEERVTFNVRWRGDLLPTDRILCEGRTFDIEAIREVGRRRELEIQATATG